VESVHEWQNSSDDRSCFLDRLLAMVQFNFWCGIS
jgi:hypothetical protein